MGCIEGEEWMACSSFYYLLYFFERKPAVLRARFIDICSRYRIERQRVLMGDIYHTIYEKLEKIGVFSIHQYAVIEKSPSVPLCIDRIGQDIYALSQNPVIDGVVVANPDIEIRVSHQNRTAEPLAFQDPTGQRVVYPEPGKVDLKAKNDLAEYLDRWLSDLLSQGFIRMQ
jgi:hypothetical protein